MRRLSLAFVLLGLVCAVFGFTSLGGSAAGFARIGFMAFAALAVGSFILSFFIQQAPAVAAAAKTTARFAAAMLLGVGIYMWVEKGMSAERVGRAIDHGVVAAKTYTVNSFNALAQNASSTTAKAVSDFRPEDKDGKKPADKTSEV